jgi:hypothetical protein
VRFPGFVGPSYQLSSVNVDCQRCINLYPEFDESGQGKEHEVASLAATPGLRLLATIGAGPIRGVFTTSTGVLFVVSGNTLYKVTSAWATTTVGTLTTSAGQVSMADNGVTLLAVDGTHGYFVTLADLTFVQISDVNYLGGNQVAFQDGYFIVNVPSSGEFQISGINDTTWDALDVASAEGNPDNLVALVSNHEELWLFNDRTTEVFYDSGSADFPFSRISGAFIEVGCAARFSVAKLGGAVFWLGQDDKGHGMVFTANGYQPERISNHAIEEAIQGYGDLSGTTAFAYQQNGHPFYVLNFTTAETTWVYDAMTKMWHERNYLNTGLLERHRADCHTFAYSTHVVGDYETGKLYALDMNYYTDNGTAIVRRRRSPHTSENMVRITHNAFELDIETGIGIDGTGQGTSPQAMLRFSDDYGHSWSNEKWTSLGAIGTTKTRARWKRLGMTRDRVYEVTISDPVKVRIMGAEIDVEKEMS